MAKNKLNEKDLKKVTGGSKVTGWREYGIAGVKTVGYFVTCPWCNKDIAGPDWEGHVNTPKENGGCSKRPDNAEYQNNPNNI